MIHRVVLILILSLVAGPVFAARPAPPLDWDVASGRGVLWRADLGTESYAGPVVAGGKVFVGTNNDRPRDPAIDDDRGVLMAFDAADGRFLWQAVHDKLPEGRAQDWPHVGVCSTPGVVGERLYYLSNRAELVALDTEGFADGEDDGVSDAPLGRGEGGAIDLASIHADRVWTLDLRAALGVVPRYMAASTPLIVGERIFVITGNGPRDDGSVPAPEAASFIAVDRTTGAVLWHDASPGARLLDGQWASPTLLRAVGQEQILMPGGDGWLYAFDPASGRQLWRFDANQPWRGGGAPAGAPAEGAAAGDGGEGGEGARERGRESLLASAAVADGRIFIGVGRDPEHGAGQGRLWALRPGGASGDDGGAAMPLWSAFGRDFGRTLSTAVVEDGILYTADLAGFIYAFDAASGERLWRHDAFAAVWGSPLLIDGHIYIGDEDGDIAILKAGRELRLVAEIGLGNAIFTTPAAADGVLYVVTSRRLYALAADAGPAPPPSR